MTSNKAREKYDLPPLTGPDGEAGAYDALRPQRLAAPVTVYVEAFSAHPLEEDAADLYAPPDGYVDAETGVFSKEQKDPSDVPVYEMTLEPEDGLYMLPYAGRQADGSAWDGNCTAPGAPMEQCRVPFYPDASRIVEEIDRFGLDGDGANNWLSRQADLDYFRPAPSGGYRDGLPESERTDVGAGDIPPEVWGEDFFTYTPYSEGPAMTTLAELTNSVQATMATGEYQGGVWLEGSPTVEESIYWLNLVIDTEVPLVGNASQRIHGMLSNEGDRNIVDSVSYINSDLWKDDQGRDKIGGVMIQEEQIFASREVQKADDRPGGYIVTGGHGGILGSIVPMKLSYEPTKKHTHLSEVNLTQMPDAVPGVQRVDGSVQVVEVPVKEDGELLASAIPKVTIQKHARYLSDTTSNEPESVVEVLARIDHNLDNFSLAGFVMEGSAPYGSGDEPTNAALDRAAMSGMPVVRVGRGNNEGFTDVSPSNLTIEGGNFTSTKARILLMAAMLKHGALPAAADAAAPTEEERAAVVAKVADYQAIFDTH